MIETINCERFEAWLAAQPRDRIIEFQDRNQCFVCSFLKETSRAKLVEAYYENAIVDGLKINLPGWMQTLFYEARKAKGYCNLFRYGSQEPITVGEMQDAYLKLYGHPESHPVQIEHVIEPEELKQAH